MSNRQLELLIEDHNKILPYLNEAILIVNDNGEIITGTEYAYSMFKITDSKVSIYSYLDINPLATYKDLSVLAKLSDDKGKVVEMKIVNLADSIKYLILKPVTFNEKTVEINGLLERSTEGIVVYENGTLIDCDDAVARMLGYTRNELIGKSITKSFKREVVTFTIGNDVKVHRGLKKDGSYFFFEIIKQPEYDSNSPIKIVIIRDLTEQVHQDKEIKQLAFFDLLTGLPNLNFFVHALQEAMDYSKQNQSGLTVYYLELDYFKEINETFGHEFTDKLLKSCVKRIRTQLTDHTFLSKVNTDEFLLYNHETVTLEQSEKFAKQLLNLFEKPVIIQDYEIYVSICIGVSIYSDKRKTYIDLIKHAYSAMYDIKDKYQNRYNVFNPLIKDKFQETIEMERELRYALKHNEFELFYQPQKELSTGKVVGFEALIRWKHPSKGYILPGKFIPLAERTGLIIELGDWVLMEACSQAKRWQDQGFHPVVMGVNMSVKQIHQQGIVEKIKHVLEQTGLEPKYLELEVTETMALTNEKLSLNTMQELKDLGVWISIDDFGTGYSSFKYLSVFPISKLKIDRMFLKDQDVHNQAIVKSIIHMSHSLDLRVIAEGVETQNQLEFLQSQKCDEIQGFYFSKPLPANELTTFLEV